MDGLLGGVKKVGWVKIGLECEGGYRVMEGVPVGNDNVQGFIFI